MPPKNENCQRLLEHTLDTWTMTSEGALRIVSHAWEEQIASEYLGVSLLARLQSEEKEIDYKTVDMRDIDLFSLLLDLVNMELGETVSYEGIEYMFRVDKEIKKETDLYEDVNLILDLDAAAAS